MSHSFFQELGIPQPDINLEVGSASAACQVAQAMERLEPVLVAEWPDIAVLVGDVTSTLAGALTASKLGMRGARLGQPRTSLIPTPIIIPRKLPSV